MPEKSSMNGISLAGLSQQDEEQPHREKEEIDDKGKFSQTSWISLESSDQSHDACNTTKKPRLGRKKKERKKKKKHLVVVERLYTS